MLAKELTQTQINLVGNDGGVSVSDVSDVSKRTYTNTNKPGRQ